MTFDPTNYSTYRYHGSMLYIDPKATISDVKKVCPLFFENARRGEKRTMYRGHIICQSVQEFSGGPQRMTSVYAFDVRRGDTFCIDTDARGLAEAKETIKAKLDTPEADPLTLSYETVEMLVPVKVRAAIFRDKDGTIQGIEADEFVHVGEPDTRQQKLPGDTFTTEVWSRLPKEIKKLSPSTEN